MGYGRSFFTSCRLANEQPLMYSQFCYHYQYLRVNLLVLDEWMLVSLKESEARDLLEIIHSRHKKASTIFCSQFAPAGWYAKIDEATLADAILERIVYDSYIIEIFIAIVTNRQ
ncbi:MAG: ATP-binding protein [Dehalococcoidales bacterium]|nr:ATP-binding protein [Dehalococcoidales bacterium]